MTHSLVVLYHQPAEPGSFDRHYETVHAKLALDLPGLRTFTGTHAAPGPDGAPGPYYFVATLAFDDQESFEAAMSGPEGRVAVDDLVNFAGGGVTLLDGRTTTYR